MKTVLIHGQNHKGSSYSIGRLLADKVANNNEIIEFFLPRDLNHFCLGCYNCLKDEKKCPFYEEKSKIEAAMENAQLLIFTTPTYCFRASAPMKSFIDLTFINWMAHRPKACMFNKRAVVVSTAAGAGTKKAMKDITTCLFYWGVPYIRTIGAIVQASSWKEVTADRKARIEKRISRLSAKLKLLENKKVKVGFKTKFMFYIMRLNMKNQEKSPMAADYTYWKNNGWLGKKRPW
jgi:multimeric flavodoxin WrbA